MSSVEKHVQSKGGVLPVLPNTELGASVIPLQTKHGKETFLRAMQAANGAAAIIVHPFFPERTDELAMPEKVEAYAAYTKRLTKSVTRYQEHGIPVVLLEGVQESEERAVIPDLPDTIQRLNATGGEIFVAATKDSDPQLLDGDLSALASELKNAGLERITVNGSFMVKVDKAGIAVDEEKPHITQRYQFEGCAGKTVEVFLAAGVDARPGGSTFSSDYLEYFYALQEQINKMQPGDTIDVVLPGVSDDQTDVVTRYLGQPDDIYERYGIHGEESQSSPKRSEVLEAEE